MIVLVIIAALFLGYLQGFTHDETFFAIANITVWAIAVCLFIYPLSRKFIKNIYRELDVEKAGILSSVLQEMKEVKPLIDNLEEKSEEVLKLSLDEQYEYIQSVKAFDFKRGSLKEPYQEAIKMLAPESEEQNVLEVLRDVAKVFNPEYNNSLRNVVQGHAYEAYLLMNGNYEKAFEQTYGSPWVRRDDLLDKISFVEKERSSIIWRVSKGVEGENSVVGAMKSMLDGFRLLESIRIEHNMQSAESDVIVVGPTGLYTLEVKNEGSAGNWNIRISSDGQWQKVYKNGNREAMKDHGGQMNHHISVQGSFLNQKLKERYGEDAPHIKMRGAIIIANDNLIIDNESDLVVLRKSSAHRFIEKGTDHIDEIWQERIVGILKEYSLPAKEYDISNIEAMTENLIYEMLRIAALYRLRNEWIRRWATSDNILYLGREAQPFRNTALQPIFPGIALGKVVLTDD